MFDRPLSLRDGVAQPGPSIWAMIAGRFGAIPMVLTFVLVSIAAVALAFEVLYALSKLA
jgi:hypothetical protein